MDSICVWTCKGLPAEAADHRAGLQHSGPGHIYQEGTRHPGPGHRLAWCRASITDSRDSGVSPVLSRVLYYLVLSTRVFTPTYAITLNFKQIWPGFTGFMCLQLNTKYILLSNASRRLLSNASRRPHVSCRMSTATVLVMLHTSAGTRNVSCSSSLNSTHSFGTGIFSHDTSPRLKIKRHKSTWITP